MARALPTEAPGRHSVTVALVLSSITAWNAAAVWFMTRWLPRHRDDRSAEERALRGMHVPTTIDFDLTTNDGEGFV